MSDNNSAQKADSAPPPTLVEWSGHLLSVLLLVGLVGYVLSQAFQAPAPVAFDYSVHQEQLREQGGSWVLPVEVHNRGGEGVLDLLVTAEMRDEAGEVVDEADISLPLLGPGEQVKVELWFEEDPRLHTLFFNLASYALP